MRRMTTRILNSAANASNRPTAISHNQFVDFSIGVPLRFFVAIVRLEVGAAQIVTRNHPPNSPSEFAGTRDKLPHTAAQKPLSANRMQTDISHTIRTTLIICAHSIASPLEHPVESDAQPNTEAIGVCIFGLPKKLIFLINGGIN